MATLSAFSTPLHLISKTHFNTPKNLSFYPNSIHFQTKFSTFSFNNLTLSSKKDKNLYGIWKLKSSEEEETAVPEQEEETVSVEQQESVSVPSDILRMYFQADGTLNEAAIPNVTKALEEAEGISNLKVQVLESIGIVELTKQTTVQATGVASNLVELIQEMEQLLGPEEKAILQQNASPNLRKISTAKWKPLQTLALSLQIPFMDKLLEDELNINEVDKDGHTALHKAIIGKKEAVINHLLRKSASPHVKDKDGATPLHYAVHVGAMQTVKLLLKYDVDVNIADRDGWTPLHIAVQSRNRDIAKVLLINGADKTRKNKDGKTALDLSLCYGKDFKSYDLAKLLKILPADRYL